MYFAGFPTLSLHFLVPKSASSCCAKQSFSTKRTEASVERQERHKKTLSWIRDHPPAPGIAIS